MARTKGTYSLPANIETNAAAPLDARSVVVQKSDLTASGSFPYPYIGMQVYVRSEGKRYTLIADDPTVLANWHEDTAGGGAVDSVNGKTGEVVLDAEDVGALPDDTPLFSGAYADLTGTPTLGTASALDVATSGDASTTQVVKGDDTRLTDSRNAADVYSWAKASTKPSYTASEIGAIASIDKGANGGVAELDANGKVPSSQLPSFVDDVVEGYYKSDTDRFYEESTYEHVITPVEGKSWVDVSTNKSYRWTGSVYVRVDEGVQLGETSDTAYRGDRGKAAYDHSQTTSGNPHNVTASEVGLGNVDNTSDATKKTNFTGSIANGNTGFVTGGDAYTALALKADIGNIPVNPASTEGLNIWIETE